MINAVLYSVLGASDGQCGEAYRHCTNLLLRFKYGLVREYRLFQKL